MIFGNPGHGFFSRKSEKYLGIDWLGRDDEENKHEKYGRKWGEGKKYFREKYNRSKLISTKQKQEKKKKKNSLFPIWVTHPASEEIMGRTHYNH